MHNSLLLQIEIFDFLKHFHWSSKILTNLQYHITHLTISSFKIIEAKSNNFILGHNIFLHSYTQVYSIPFCILLY
jgi:hypothetical protein